MHYDLVMIMSMIIALLKIFCALKHKSKQYRKVTVEVFSRVATKDVDDVAMVALIVWFFAVVAEVLVIDGVDVDGVVLVRVALDDGLLVLVVDVLNMVVVDSVGAVVLVLSVVTVVPGVTGFVVVLVVSVRVAPDDGLVVLVEMVEGVIVPVGAIVEDVTLLDVVGVLNSVVVVSVGAVLSVVTVVPGLIGFVVVFAGVEAIHVADVGVRIVLAAVSRSATE